MSLPKLNSFLGIELELGVKIFSLVLAIMEGYTSEACVVKEEIAVIKEQLRELSKDMGEATVY